MANILPNNQPDYKSKITSLYNQGFSIIPIESNSKLPAISHHRPIPIYKLKNGPLPDEQLYQNDSGMLFVKRPTRINWKRFINKQVSKKTFDKWLVKYQNCNFAIINGVNNLVTIDVDLKGSNRDVKQKLFEKWILDNQFILNFPMTKTINNGYHFYFKSSGKIDTQAWRINDIVLGEIRSTGSYNLLPDNQNYFEINPLSFDKLVELNLEDLSSLICSFNYNYLTVCKFYQNRPIEPLNGDSDNTEENKILDKNDTKLTNNPLIIHWSKEYYFNKSIERNYEKILKSQIGQRMINFNNEYLSLARIVKNLGFKFSDLQPLIDAGLLAGLTQNEIDATVKHLTKLALNHPRNVIFEKLPIEKSWHDSDNYPDEKFVYKSGEQNRLTLSRRKIFEDLISHVNYDFTGDTLLGNELQNGFYSTAGSQKLFADRCNISVRSWQSRFYELSDMGYVKLHEESANNRHGKIWSYRLGYVELSSDNRHKIKWYIDEPPVIEMPIVKQLNVEKYTSEFMAGLITN